MWAWIIFFIIIILNAVAACLVLIWQLNANDTKLAISYFIVILACPIVGGLYYLGAYLLLRTSFRNSELTYADISFDSSRHEKKQKGNFLEEVDILPLEEAFVVSEKHDRRKALLSVLKKDITKNISSILLALNNDDSETSHYAASVILSTSTDFLNDLTKLKYAYEHESNEDNPDPACAYLAGLNVYMQSNIMDTIDKAKYIHIYNDVLSWLYINFKELITVEDFVNVITLLVEIAEYENARGWAMRARHRFPEEDSILFAILRLHYQSGAKEDMLALIKEIMNSNINISNDMLQIIRFFTYAPAKT